MFEIGFRTVEETNDINRGKFPTDSTSYFLHRLQRAKNDVTQLTEDYVPLSKLLPSMVDFIDKGIKNITRLKILKGKLPYVPCRIKIYDQNSIRKCFEKREKKNKKLWIIFYGDSKMRNAFLFFTSFTQQIFHWMFTDASNSSIPMTLKQLKEDKKLEPYVNREATSFKGDKITYVVSKFGLPLDHLLNITEVEKTIPDLIIIEFGLWSALENGFQNFKSEDKSLISWLIIKHKLRKMAEKTTIIAAVQSRLRTPPQSYVEFWKISPTEKQHYARYRFLDVHHSDYLDIAMISAIWKNKFVIWDSSLPLNLASSADCAVLYKLNHTILWKEAKGRSVFTEFMCHDDVHRSRSTLQDEAYMLLNYLCNKYIINNNEGECCL